MKQQKQDNSQKDKKQKRKVDDLKSENNNSASPSDKDKELIKEITRLKEIYGQEIEFKNLEAELKGRKEARQELIDEFEKLDNNKDIQYTKKWLLLKQQLQNMKNGKRIL